MPKGNKGVRVAVLVKLPLDIFLYCCEKGKIGLRRNLLYPALFHTVAMKMFPVLHRRIVLESKTTIQPTQLFLLSKNPIYIQRRKPQNQVLLFFPVGIWATLLPLQLVFSIVGVKLNYFKIRLFSVSLPPHQVFWGWSFADFLLSLLSVYNIYRLEMTFSGNFLSQLSEQL